MDFGGIIKKLKNNDFSCFSEFYQETHKQVYFSALSILKDHSLAEDIMQDTYVAFIENVHDVKANCNIYAYLSTIARNLSINHYNKFKTIVGNDQIIENQIGEEVNYDRDVDKILQLLDDSDEREIVVYHVILEYKFSEISSIMDKPLGTVLWIYNKAMKKLKERIEKLL